MAAAMIQLRMAAGAGDHIEYPGRQPGLLIHPGQLQKGQHAPAGGLDDAGIPGCQNGVDLLAAHEIRPIPGQNLRHHPNGIPGHIVQGSVVRGNHRPLAVPCLPGEEIEGIHRHGDAVIPGSRIVVAALQGLQRSKFIRPALHDPGGLPQNRCPIPCGGTAPGALVKSPSGSLNRFFRILHAAPKGLCKHFVVGRVHAVLGFPGGRWHILSVYVQPVGHFADKIHRIHGKLPPVMPA